MFKKHKKIIDKKIKRTMIRISRHIAEELTNETVPVRSGHYVKSHVVKVSLPTYPRAAIAKPPPYQRKLYGGEAKRHLDESKERLKRISRAIIETGDYSKLYFGNRAKYAHLVEYLGWTGLHEQAKTGPYFIFKKAAASTELRKKSIARMP